MDVRLPDGTIIQNVPEGTTRTQLIELLRRNEYDVSSLTPPSERTLGGYTKEAFKGLIPGFVGLGETAITGAASLLPERAEQAVRKPVEEFATGVRETFAPAPGYEDTLVRKISEGVGSTAPFLGLGLLGAAGKIGAAGLSVSTGAGEARQKAEEAGATEGQRGVATALGTIPGALEALPPIRILRRFGFGDEAIKEVAGLAPALGRIAKSGGEEALQEASSQVLQNLIAKGVYAPDEAVFGGVGEAATVGGGAGAVISAIAELALGRRLRSSEAAGQEASPETQEETTEEAPPTEPPAPVAAESAVEEVGETQREATERRARELRVSTREEADLRARETGLRAREETNLRAREEARRRPIGDEDQMGLPLEGGFAQPDLFAEPSEPISGMYRPAEEVLGEQGLKPRSRAFKAEAKDLGLRLDRKGNLKPNQFVPEVTAKPSPDQESFEFEYQQQLPLTLPSELEGQGDLFAQEPIPPGSTVPFARQQPVAETPAVEVPKEQFALDLPGIPMERLVPRDRVLRAMAITEDKKNIPNLRFATGLRPMELQKTIGDLKKEGAIAFNKKANEWELTPAGTERVQTPVELPAAPPTTPPAAPEVQETPAAIRESRPAAPIDMTKRRDAQLFAEEEAFAKQHAAVGHEQLYREHLEDLSKNQDWMRETEKKANVISRLKDIIGLESYAVNQLGIDYSLNRWNAIANSFSRFEEPYQAYTAKELISRDKDDIDQRFAKYISAVRNYKNELNPSSARERRVINEIDSILGDMRVSPIQVKPKVTAPAAPPITPPEAPRGTEPVTSEIVGGAGAGSTELPVSRVPARGQGPAGAGVEGLGVPNVPAARVDGREEVTEPTLTAAPAAPPPRGPTPPGPPSGTAPTPPTPPQRPTTPSQVVQGVQNALNSVTQSIIDRPNYTDSYGQKIIDWIGNLPLSKRKIQFALYTLSQMKQLLSTIMPGVAFVEKVNGRRAAQTSQELDHVAKNQSKYKNIIARYPKAKWEKLKEVAKLGTLYQVDPTDPSVKQLHNDVSGRIKNVESLTPVEKVQYEIAAMYYSLPTDLRGILISDDGKSGIVPEYRKYRRQKFEAMIRNWIKQKMPSSEIAELRRQFNDPKNNLSFYIPLRRDQGVYWLTYTDKNNNEVSKIFSNPIERAVFRRQIEAQGVTKILESSRYSDIKGEDRGKPPTGFLGEIVAMLKSSIPEDKDPKKNKAKNDLISEVYDIFLDYMPQNTLRQELSSREVLDLGDGVKQFGKFGFNEDFLETYVKETPRIIYQLNNLRWVLPIEDAMRKLGEQREKYNNERNNAAFMRGRLDMPPEQVNEAFDSIRKRVDFGYSPTYAPWVYQIATGNYIFSIAANISSGLINTTVIPMLAIPILAAKYGVTPTLRAITRASAMFVKAPKEGGFKALGVRIGDFSIANGATGEYEQFFKKLVSRGVIGAASEQELLLAQRLEITGYDSLGDKVNYLAGYVMKNTERFNRETTLLASFMLAREKGKNFTDAFEEAITDNSDVNGASLPASDSRLYQTGLGRVLLTFRKYILNAAILIAGTFKEAVARIEPNNQKQKLLRTVARRRLLGIYAGSYMVSGIGGMPLFGAAEMLAAFMMGDDDEPYDLQQEVMESIGDLGLNGPVNALFNLDVASRAGFTDVLWRDDPKRLAEVGYITFGLEKLAGPTYSNFMNFGRAFEEMSEGRIWRGTEAFLPAAGRNALKALRYAIEGARTKNGVPIKEDIEKWNLAMQVFGFAPADLATTQARVGAEFEISKKLRQRRTALYTQLYAAISAGNGDAVRDVYNSIAAYNKANPAIAIDFEGIEQSFRQRDRRNAESIDGLYLEKNLRQATIPYVSPRD